MPEKLALRLSVGFVLGVVVEVWLPELRTLWAIVVVTVLWRRFRAAKAAAQPVLRMVTARQVG